MAGGSGGGLGLMALNDTKAGMEGLDKESISKVLWLQMTMEILAWFSFKLLPR